MKNRKYHKYIEYLLKKLDKRYNKNIILYYEPKCHRANILFNPTTNQHLFTYGDTLINNSVDSKSHSRDYLRYVIMHEVGHIYHYLDNYETFNDKVVCEYKAERFALNRLKEYYPKTYNWVCKEGKKILLDKTWAVCKSENHYRKAWEMIKEYQS